MFRFLGIHPRLMHVLNSLPRQRNVVKCIGEINVKWYSSCRDKRRIQPFNYFIWITGLCNFYGVVPFNSRIYSKNMIKVKTIMCRTMSCCYCYEDYRV